MKLFVDKMLILELIEQRFGGLDNFLHDCQQSGAMTAQRVRAVKTVYGWLQGGLPRQRETVFSFFGMLGVDPVAVVDIEPAAC